MHNAIQIAKLRGIPIRVHWSLLVALPLLGSLFARNFAAAAVAAGFPLEQLSNSLWLWGLLCAAGLFASVVIHELAHSIYAMRTGGKVADITLLIIGGMSRLSEPPKRPRDEGIMALVGPLASLLLGAALLGAYLLSSSLEWFNLRFALYLLGSLNIGLGLFNLLPAFPMDGGRILRSALTPRLGMLRATQVASTVGKVFAVAFAIFGVLSFSFFLVLIGFFVYVGAEAEGRMVTMREALGKLRVADLMTSAALPIPAEASVADAARRMQLERTLALPVLRADRIDGVVSLGAVRAVPIGERDAKLVGALAQKAPVVAATADAGDVLDLMEAPSAVLLVVDGNELVGMLSQADVLRALALGSLDVGPRRSLWRRQPTHA